MSRRHDPPPSFTVDPQTPNRRVRHQSSLEHVFNFTLASPKPTHEQSTDAYALYNEIIADCQEADLFLPAGDDADGGEKVYLHNLFRALVCFCPTAPGRINIVRMILHGLFCADKVSIEERSLGFILPLACTWRTATEQERQPIYRILETVAADFLLGFFVPLCAQASTTPHVSGILSPPTAAATISPSQGTPHRLQGLRRTCLLRDGNRCVVTGHLDKEVFNRLQRRGQTLPGTFGVQTQAAHIIPHSLNAIRAGDALTRGKTFVWQILNMFDSGISTQLEGPLIDSPANAFILATELHDEFGRLRCYFEEVAPGSYEFRKTRFATTLSPAADAKASRLTFVNHEPEGTGWADLPSSRLLKLHAACCKMVEMAGAADYVDWAVGDLERMEEGGTLAANGTSDVGMLLLTRGLAVWGGGVDVEWSDMGT